MSTKRVMIISNLEPRPKLIDVNLERGEQIVAMTDLVGGNQTVTRIKQLSSLTLELGPRQSVWLDFV